MFDQEGAFGGRIMRKAIAVLPVFALAGYGGAAPAAKTKVNYLTSFSTFGRNIYAYVAQEKGSSQRPGSTSRSRRAPAASTC